MTDFRAPDLGRAARRLRADTLVRLRWLAIAGQTAAVLVVYFGLGFQLPIGICLGVIALSAAVNIALRLRYPVNHRLDDAPATFLLAYDLVQLSALLWLTGGLQNPFMLLLLAPVTISATSLPPRHTLALGLLMVGCVTLLIFFHWPLPWFPGEEVRFPFFYSMAIWGSLVLAAGFTGIYASRVAQEARQLADALAATDLVLAREQHLSQLDGLAAAAAHELGTPLATITLVVKEWLRALPEPPTNEDIALVAQEVERCRTILAKLSSLGDEDESPFEALTVTHLLEEAVEPHRHFGVALHVETQGSGSEPVCPRNPGLAYGLGNLIENAVDFAKTDVTIRIRWDAERVMLTISDDGPGFSPDVLLRIGEPYVTTRGPQRKARQDEGGLGLGLFIAKTLLERSGAHFSARNAKAPGAGAEITLDWPRRAFEGPQAD